MFNNLLVEKYRPGKLSDMVLSGSNRKFFDSITDEIPNLLFVGTPGLGKTTLAKILVNDVLQCQYLYINASDENGIDTISNPRSTENIFIDLRPGAHSYEGHKSNFITNASQLTISHGSEIENVETGHGDDTVVGNDLSNIIRSGSGNDVIFPGEGEDIVYTGLGNDTIDFSEDINLIDTVVFDKVNEKESFDIIYGFIQGKFGDILDISVFGLSELNILPIIDVVNIPNGYVDRSLVKIFGKDLDNVRNLTSHFEKGGVLESLKLSEKGNAILITANSQNTGETQNISSITRNGGSIEVDSICQLVGNYLDIDNWTIDNFIA